MNSLQKIFIGLFGWLLVGAMIGIPAGVTGGAVWWLLFGIPFGLFLMATTATMAGLVIALLASLLSPSR